MKTKFGVLISLLFLIGCSAGDQFKVDTFSKEDMCIIPSDGGKDKICYGMARSDVEKSLGTGQQSNSMNVNYNSSVSIFYRNDIVAGVSLEQGSQNKYKTSRGAEIGMTKADIKQLYGTKYAVDHGELIMDYYYDSVANRLMEDESIIHRQTQEDAVNTYILSVILESSATSADRIVLMDLRMAAYLN